MRASSSRFSLLAAAVLSLLLGAANAPAQVLLSEGTNLAVDVSPSAQKLAIDLLGSIWILDAGGGPAQAVSDNLQPARRPQWSPDGEHLLYHVLGDTRQLHAMPVPGMRRPILHRAFP
ncbi:MAG TPA: hypothetical protein VHG33_01050, partial [Woeseiaceae bacterium]|nr:hypothetical protein [Woeseiaceae bacterium]